MNKQCYELKTNADVTNRNASAYVSGDYVCVGQGWRAELHSRGLVGCRGLGLA